MVKRCFLCIIDVLFRVIMPQLNTRESEEIETVMQTRDTVKGFHNLILNNPLSIKTRRCKERKSALSLLQNISQKYARI